jgi:hypothetical protein
MRELEECCNSALHHTRRGAFPVAIIRIKKAHSLSFKKYTRPWLS